MMERSIQISWSTEDVKSLDSSLTFLEALEVLVQAKENHDADIGINWGVLQFYIDIIKRSRRRKRAA